ncbi:hypothetical protein [Paraburkholderia kururiensis]|uniref:Uncharacterized protein n=1 Tax=Paraburkholderia kururiensis TaxID=984307 RepID=A0ABZ0WPS2_9BURK|nr:hypothetical protein [Paraburkholderia kururiensis]WQD79392.1 hypothetical protein U0042_06740 [Paraburkholderia kururiensis]
MQAQKRFAQLVLPVVFALPSFAAQAADAPAAATGVATEAARTAQATAVPISSAAREQSAATTATPAPAVSPAPAAAAIAPPDAQFGVALDASRLDTQRGGDVMVGQNNLTGTVADNTAYKVVTGSNSINDGSFSNSSGLPTVIQNTGANVLIQNATVLNVRFGN